MAPIKTSRMALRRDDKSKTSTRLHELSRRHKASATPHKTSRKTLRDQDKPKIYIRNPIFIRKLIAAYVNDGRPKIFIRNREFIRRLAALSHPVTPGSGSSPCEQPATSRTETNAPPSSDEGSVVNVQPPEVQPLDDSRRLLIQQRANPMLAIEGEFRSMTLQCNAKQAPAAMNLPSSNFPLGIEQAFTGLNLHHNANQALAAISVPSSHNTIAIEKPVDATNLQCIAKQALAAMNEPSTNAIQAIEEDAGMSLQDFVEQGLAEINVSLANTVARRRRFFRHGLLGRLRSKF